MKLSAVKCPSIARTRTLGALVLAFGLSLSACVGARAPGSAPAVSREWAWTFDPSVADSVSTEVLAPSTRLHRLVNRSVPWTAAVLEIDLGRCVMVRSVKGGATGVGRRTTSALLASLDHSDSAFAAVNADFFSFAPAGVPTGAHVERGRLITGPGARPVFGLDSAGRPFIDVLAARGTLRSKDGEFPVLSWNRPQANAVNVVDAAWGAPIDTAVLGQSWVLAPAAGGGRYVVRREGTTLPAGEEILIVRGRAFPGAAWSLRVGDTVDLVWSLRPIHPMDAVGGFPVLLRDSVIPTGAATAGAESFSGPNPRTAVGFSGDGRRLFLAVIDGRRPGVSAGMTLQQTSDLMRALGAREALNLDGGGSSALVVRDARTGGALRVVTQPSDATGERAVGNALAVMSQCAPASRR